MIARAAEANEDELFNEGIRPDVITYTAVINAFAQRGLVQTAEKVFEMMFQDYKSGNEQAKPDEAAFNAVVNGLAIQQDILYNKKSKRLKQGNGAQADFKQLALEEMEEQTAFYSPERAEQILERMEELCHEGLLDFTPSVCIYASVLKAWAKSKRPDGPKRARAILDKMKLLHHSGPNTIAYNVVIDSYSRAGNVKEAEALLQEMLDEYNSGRNVDAKPNIMSYTACITAYGRIKNKYWIEPEMAESTLRRMQKLGDPNVKAEHICYTSVIDVYAKACIFGDSKNRVKYLKRVEELLDEMIELSDMNGHKSAAPSAVTYNTVLKAIAFCKAPIQDRKERAKRVFALMTEKGLQPDSYTLSVLAKAIANNRK
jgi:pentatricopeptide repeat protein